MLKMNFSSGFGSKTVELEKAFRSIQALANGCGRHLLCTGEPGQNRVHLSGKGKGRNLSGTSPGRQNIYYHNKGVHFWQEQPH